MRSNSHPRSDLNITCHKWWTRLSARAKNLDTYIQAYMPHESSGDSSNQPCKVYNRQVQSSTVQYTPVTPSTAQYSPVPPSSAQYRPVLPITAQHRPTQPSTAQYWPLQPSTAQYSPVQPNTSQYSPVQPNTAHIAVCHFKLLINCSKWSLI